MERAVTCVPPTAPALGDAALVRYDAREGRSGILGHVAGVDGQHALAVARAEREVPIRPDDERRACQKGRARGARTASGGSDSDFRLTVFSRSIAWPL